MLALRKNLGFTVRHIHTALYARAYSCLLTLGAENGCRPKFSDER